MNWFGAAFLSSIFAALTAILAKIGVKDVNSNLATAIRTVVILFFALGVVVSQGVYKELANISRYSIIFLILSGLSTGISWLFYFYALKVGNVSQVIPVDRLSLLITIFLAFIILKEKINLMLVTGALLMTMGAIMISLAR